MREWVFRMDDHLDFGGYAIIQTDYSKSPHKYKIINVIRSNSYCDIPILTTSEPNWHNEVETVLNVIHCGIDETKVVRVALKDCERFILPQICGWNILDCEESPESKKQRKRGSKQ